MTSGIFGSFLPAPPAWMLNGSTWRKSPNASGGSSGLSSAQGSHGANRSGEREVDECREGRARGECEQARDVDALPEPSTGLARRAEIGLGQVEVARDLAVEARARHGRAVARVQHREHLAAGLGRERP